MQKVIVLGVDGATLDVMEPWMDQGKLPNFNKIRTHGVYGKLRSTIPHYSAPAWVSIVTGCNPGKHGIYDFFRTDSLSKKLVSSRLRKAPAIWNFLSDLGKQSIIVNVPGTYPPEPIKGIMITGLLTPSLDSEYTYPKNVKNELVSGKLGAYELEQVAVDDLPKSLYARYAPEKLIEKTNNVTASHATVFLNLLQTNDWDFAMVVFRGPDDVQHLLWNNQELILSCYQKADGYIGRIIEMFPDALIIIVSDHGFEQSRKYLYVNNVLFNAGYLKTKADPNMNLSNLLMILFDKLSRLLFHVAPIDKLARSSLGRKLILSGGGSKNIDFTKTKAVYHSVCSRGIRIAHKGKYEHGIVSRDEYEHLRDELIQLFEDLKDPDTGKQIIHKVYRFEELYGKHAENDPLDLILDVNRGYGTQELLRSPKGMKESLQLGSKTLSYLSQPGFYDWLGDHAPYGIVFMYGPGVKKNQKISASVLDIVPTVLAAMELSIPDCLDGSILKDAFSKIPKVKKVHWEQLSQKKHVLSESERKKIDDLRRNM